MAERFSIYSGTELIGYSAFEHDDRSMGVRMGCFYPEPGYSKFQPIYQEMTSAGFEACQVRGSDERRTLEERYEQLREQTATFDLHVQTFDGRILPTVFIHIEDASAELNEEECQITLHINDHLIFETFFPEVL